MPRVRFSLLESLDGCHWVWVIAAGCAVSLRGCPAACRAQGGTGLQGFTRHVLPSRGNLQRGRFFERKPLPLLPCLYSLQVFPSISGSARSSWEGAQLLRQRQGWQCPLASIICAGTQLVLGQAAPLAFGVPYF